MGRTIVQILVGLAGLATAAAISERQELAIGIVLWIWMHIGWATVRLRSALRRAAGDTDQGLPSLAFLLRLGVLVAGLYGAWRWLGIPDRDLAASTVIGYLFAIPLLVVARNNNERVRRVC